MSWQCISVTFRVKICSHFYYIFNGVKCSLWSLTNQNIGCHSLCLVMVPDRGIQGIPGLMVEQCICPLCILDLLHRRRAFGNWDVSPSQNWSCNGTARQNIISHSMKLPLIRRVEVPVEEEASLWSQSTRADTPGTWPGRTFLDWSSCFQNRIYVSLWSSCKIMFIWIQINERMSGRTPKEWNNGDEKR